MSHRLNRCFCSCFGVIFFIKRVFVCAYNRFFLFHLLSFMPCCTSVPNLKIENADSFGVFTIDLIEKKVKRSNYRSYNSNGISIGFRLKSFFLSRFRFASSIGISAQGVSTASKNVQREIKKRRKKVAFRYAN